MIFVLEYLLRWTAFISANFDFIHFHQKSFSKKNMLNLCWHSLQLSYMISKNPFRKVIWVQKSIGFLLKHQKIPQTSAHYSATFATSCYYRMLSVVNLFNKICSLKRKDIIFLIHKFFNREFARQALLHPDLFSWLHLSSL